MCLHKAKMMLCSLLFTAGEYFFAPPEYFPDVKYAPLHIGKIVPLISN